MFLSFLKLRGVPTKLYFSEKNEYLWTVRHGFHDVNDKIDDDKIKNIQRHIGVKPM